MPITLVAPGLPIPTPTEEPIKRGRGRPPGSKNKPTNIEPPVIESNEEEAPPAEEPPEEPAEEPIEAPSEPDEPPPPPKQRERKPRKPPPPSPPPSPPPPPPKKRPKRVVHQQPETPPETPRAAKSRMWREYREAQASAQTQRRDHFSGILDRFMR